MAHRVMSVKARSTSVVLDDKGVKGNTAASRFLMRRTRACSDATRTAVLQFVLKSFMDGECRVLFCESCKMVVLISAKAKTKGELLEIISRRISA
jgi:hypothetical protein